MQWEVSKNFTVSLEMYFQFHQIINLVHFSRPIPNFESVLCIVVEGH